jgi:type I restriction enzyme R subunit
MAINEKTAKEIKLDERNHVEKPLLDQLAGLQWEVIDLDSKQHPRDTFRENFTEVVMPPVLRAQLKVINPWLEDDQVEEAVKHLTASFPSTALIQNNRHVLHLMLENTSVSENPRRAKRARRSASSTSSVGTITVLPPYASSRCVSSAPKITSSPTSFCS